MFRAALVLFPLILLGGCVTPGERLIQVRAEPISEAGTPLTNCVLGLYLVARDQLLAEKSISREFISSFVDPPQQGHYYLKVTCPGKRDAFQSSAFDFARGPYFHELGRVVIGK
jgi:hypothetical protein